MSTKTPVTIFWFRRDLRLNDNHGLFRALEGPYPVLPFFIFDPLILDQLSGKEDKRVSFIHETLSNLAGQLEKLGSTLYVLHDKPVDAFREITRRFTVGGVMTNHDFEPYAIERDMAVEDFLKRSGIPFQHFKDQVIFDPMEIMKADGTPYVVYTPFSREWKKRLADKAPAAYTSERRQHCFLQHPPMALPSLKKLGFTPIDPGVKAIDIRESLIRKYGETRDLPYLSGTSLAGPHLRFGTVSIRHLVRLALQWNETWLNELIWREFFMMILYHFPRVVTHSFRPEYDRIDWRNNEEEFQAWCEGKTGYPLVDAGMRQLNKTGWMHNRVRMVTASFLTKDLLIDWRWGEAYFAGKLLDYELSSNNGNWQWAAGSGCDAAPYFRIFNPTEQAKKFDPDSLYIKRWIPGFQPGYLPEIVDHAEARLRTLRAYKKALG